MWMKTDIRSSEISDSQKVQSQVSQLEHNVYANDEEPYYYYNIFP